jgi:hypothetical protein
LLSFICNKFNQNQKDEDSSNNVDADGRSGILLLAVQGRKVQLARLPQKEAEVGSGGQTRLTKINN